MGGIYIPNTEKPKRCDDCWALDDKYDYPMCLITQEQRGYNFNTMTQIMDKCLIIDIVTCGECKYYSNNTEKKNYIIGCCIRTNCIPPMKPTDFCSYGERRNEI